MIPVLKYQSIVYWRYTKDYYMPYNLNYFHGYLKIGQDEFIKLGANVYKLCEIDFFIDLKNQLTANPVPTNLKTNRRYK